MNEVPSNTDGLYDEVCQCLAAVFDVSPESIQEETTLKNIGATEEHLRIAFGSFANQMKLLLTLEDLSEVLSGMHPRPCETSEEVEDLMPQLLDITVIQLVAFVRERLS